VIAVDTNRGRLRPVYDQIYNHYVQRLGIAAPWSEQAAARIRPEGAAQSADHPGFGTLLFTRRSEGPARRLFGQNAAPAAPAGLIAQARVGAGAGAGATGSAETRLTWVESVDASGYSVKRATSPRGPFTVLATDVKIPRFLDAQAEPGRMYWYTVSATNPRGDSGNALATAICTGLPSPWRSADVGPVQVEGWSSYDGTVFTLEGAGRAIGGTADEFQWLHLPLAGDGALVARFVPQFSSQFSRFGLLMRAGQDAGAPQVALLFTNARDAGVERPNWRADLVTRAAAGAEARKVASSPNLPAPHVTYGRMLEPYWLKLQRQADAYVGSISPDGVTWTEVGRAELVLGGNVQAGLGACSSLITVTTRVMFDNVQAPGWTPRTP
jgi:hypothetical protein